MKFKVVFFFYFRESEDNLGWEEETNSRERK